MRIEEEGTGGSERVAAWGVTEVVAHSAIWSIRSSSGSVPLAVVVEAAAIWAAGVSFTVVGSRLVAGGVAGPRGGWVGVVLLAKASREYSARLVAHEKGEHEGGRKGSRISPRDRTRRAAAALRTFWVSGESSSSVCRWALRR